ncbi:MAG: ribonuclease P protein component [Oscillospiraceae bacterium]
MKSKLATINKGFLFSRAYRSKQSFVTPSVVTYVLPKKRGGVRIGITATKKLGCAVERNRARRIVRAAATELLLHARGSYDIVFVCRSAVLQKKSTDVREILRANLSKAGVIDG